MISMVGARARHLIGAWHEGGQRTPFPRNCGQWPICNADVTKPSCGEVLPLQNNRITILDISQIHHFLLNNVFLFMKSWSDLQHPSQGEKWGIHHEQAAHIEQFENVVCRSRKNKSLDTILSLLLYKYGSS